MNLHKRLEAIEAALSPADIGEPCTRCGVPERADRRDIVHLLIGEQLGKCDQCGRHLDMRNNARPIVAGKVIHLVRGEPPEGWPDD